MFSSFSSWLTGDDKKNNHHQQQQHGHHPQQPQHPQQRHNNNNNNNNNNNRQPLPQQSSTNNVNSHIDSHLMSTPNDPLTAQRINQQQQLQQQQYQQQQLQQQPQIGNVMGQKFTPQTSYVLPLDQNLPSTQHSQLQQYQLLNTSNQQQSNISQSPPSSTTSNPTQSVFYLPKQDSLPSIQSKRDLWQLYYMDDDTVHQYINGISSTIDISNDIETLLYAAKQNVCIDVDDALAQCYPHLLHDETPSSRLSTTDLSTALAKALIVIGGDVGLLKAMSEVCLKRAKQIDLIAKYNNIPTYFGESSPNDNGSLEKPLLNEYETNIPMNNNNNNDNNNNNNNSTPIINPSSKQLPPPHDINCTHHHSKQCSHTPTTNTYPHQKHVYYQYPAHPPIEYQQAATNLCHKCHIKALSRVYLPNRFLNPISHFCAHTTVFLPSLGDNQGIYDALKRSITLPRPISVNPNGLMILSPFSLYVQNSMYLLNEYMHKYHLIVTTPFSYRESYQYMIEHKLSMFWKLLQQIKIGEVSLLQTIPKLNNDIGILSITNEQLQSTTSQKSQGITTTAPQIEVIGTKMNKKGTKGQKNKNQQQDKVDGIEINTTTGDINNNNTTDIDLHQLPPQTTSTTQQSSFNVLTPISPYNDTNLQQYTYRLLPTNIHKTYQSTTNSKQSFITDMINRQNASGIAQNEDLTAEQASMYALCENAVIVPLERPIQSFLSLAIHRTRPGLGFKIKTQQQSQQPQQSTSMTSTTSTTSNQNQDNTNSNGNGLTSIGEETIQDDDDSNQSKLIISNNTNDKNNNTKNNNNQLPLPTPAELGYYTHVQLNSIVDTRPLLRQGSFVALSVLHHHVHTKIRLSEDNLFLYWLVDTSTSSVELRKPASSPLPSPIVKELRVLDDEFDMDFDSTIIDNDEIPILSPTTKHSQTQATLFAESISNTHKIVRNSLSLASTPHSAWNYETNQHIEFLPETDFHLHSTSRTIPTSYITTKDVKFSVSTHDTDESIETLNNLITGKIDRLPLVLLQQQSLIPKYTNIFDQNQSIISLQQQNSLQSTLLDSNALPTTNLSRQGSHNNTLSSLEQVELDVELALQRSSSIKNKDNNNNTPSIQRTPLKQPQQRSTSQTRRYSQSNINTFDSNIQQDQSLFQSHSSIQSHQHNNNNNIRPIFDISPNHIPSMPVTNALNLSSPIVHRLYATYYDVRIASVNDVMLYVHTHYPMKENNNSNQNQNGSNNLNVNVNPNSPFQSPPQLTPMDLNKQLSMIDTPVANKSNDNNNNNNTNNNNDTKSTQTPSQTDQTTTTSSSTTDSSSPHSTENRVRANSSASITTTSQLQPHQQPIDLSVNLALYSHLQQQKTRHTHIGTRIQSYVSSLPPSTRGIPIEAIIGIEEFTTIANPFQHYSSCMYAHSTNVKNNNQQQQQQQQQSQQQTNPSNTTVSSNTPTVYIPSHDINFDQSTCIPLSQCNHYDRLYQHQGCNLYNSYVTTLEEQIANGNQNPDQIKDVTTLHTNSIPKCTLSSNDCLSTKNNHNNQQCSSMCDNDKNNHNNQNSQQSTPSGKSQGSVTCTCSGSHLYGIKIIYEVPQRIPQSTTPQEYWSHLNKLDSDNRKYFQQQCLINGWDYQSIFIPFPYLRVYKKQLVVQFVDKNEQLAWLYSILKLKHAFQSTLAENEVESLKKLIINEFPLHLKIQDFNLKFAKNNTRYATTWNTTLSPILQQQSLFGTLPPQLQSQLVEPLSLIFDPKSGLNLKKRFGIDLEQHHQQIPQQSISSTSPQQNQDQTTTNNNSDNANPPIPNPTSTPIQLTNPNGQTAMILRAQTKIHFRLPLVSRIICPSLIQLLFSQVGRRASLVKWHLGYSLMLDGADIGKLWKQIKGYSHSFFFLRTNDNDVIGGYSGSQWKPEGGYHGNHESFVFKLNQNYTYLDELHGTKMVAQDNLPPSLQHITKDIDFTLLNQPFTTPTLPDDSTDISPSNGNGGSSFPSSLSTLGTSMSTLQSSMSTLGSLNLSNIPLELTEQQLRYIDDVDLLPLTTFANGIPEIYPWKGPLQYFVFTNRDAFGFGGGGGTALHIWNNLGQGKSEFSGSFQNPQLSKNKEFKIYELEVWVGK